MTTQAQIGQWFDQAKRDGAMFLIVVCDTFDYEDYPVYAETEEHFWDQFEAHNDKNMQRVMEVYDVRKAKQPQLNEVRAWHLPERLRS